MQKNKILLIIIFAAFAALLYSAQLQAVPATNKQKSVPKGTVVSGGIGDPTKPPANYKGDWVFEKRCSNGVGVWECKGSCTAPKEKEPKHKTKTQTSSKTVSTTTTTIPIPNPPPNSLNPNWVSVLGYAASFNQCNTLCNQYQQSNCDTQLAIQYCSSVVSVDLDKNGEIVSSEIGTSPSGTKNCETNARCYDVIDNCVCDNMHLNLGTCISLFFQSYMKTGLSASQALQNVAKDTTENCQSPRS